MKSRAVQILVLVILLFSLTGHAFVGTFYAPDNRDGIVITLKEVDGLYSGTLRVEGDVYQVECFDQGGFLEGQVLGKPIRVSATRNGPFMELSLVNVTWGALPDPTTARTYVLEMQGETSSAAANYVQSGPGGTQAVVFNGMLLERKQLEDFFKQYRHYPLPGNYWYDSVSGLYGAVGFDAFGYLQPGHQFGFMLAGSSKGDSRYFINGRNLTRSEALVWRRLLGRDLRPGNYLFDGLGNLELEGRRDFRFNLFEHADVSSLEMPADVGDFYWTNRFSRGRRDSQRRGDFYSVPGYGPDGYGFLGELQPREE